MKTGHVGAEYVEYVLRHKRGLTPAAAPLYLGDPALDAHLPARARSQPLRPARRPGHDPRPGDPPAPTDKGDAS